MVVGCGSQCVDALLLLSLILIVKYFSVRRFSLQDLFYHMDAVVLCSRLLMFLNSCISFDNLSFVNLLFIGPCIILLVEEIEPT